MIADGEFQGQPEFHYYEVEMPNPTDAAMALFWFARFQLNHAATLDAIAAKYWRLAHHPWNFLESLDRTMTVISEIAAPDPYAVMGVANNYVNDVQLAHHLWP